MGRHHLLIWDSQGPHNQQWKAIWCKEFQGILGELEIEQWFASVAHPRTNGLPKVINRTILQGLKKRLEGVKVNWTEELPSVLWSYRTTPRKATSESPFHLCLCIEALIPVEIGFPSARSLGFFLEENGMGDFYGKTFCLLMICEQPLLERINIIK